MTTVNGVTPVLKVAFGSSIFEASPTYVDLQAVSRCIEVVEYESGWEDRDRHASVGTLRAVLNNSDNRFDPDNASSPYWPNLVGDKQVVFEGTIGSTFKCFDGWTEWWEINEDGPGTVTLHAVDALGLMARFRETTVGFRRKALSWSPAPSAYWRLGDRDSASTAYDETGNRRFATHGLGPRVRSEGLLVADGDAATALDALRVVVGTTQVGLSGTSHGLHMVIQPAALPASSEVLFYQDIGGGDYIELSLSPTGQVTLSDQAGALVVTSTALVTTDRPAAIGLRRNGSSWTLGVNVGSGVQTYSGTKATSATASWPVFGGLRSGAVFVSSFNGTVDEVVIWPSSDPGASMLSTLTDLAVRPGYGEVGVTRFLSLMELIQFPSARTVYDFDPFYEIFPFGPHPSSPANALALLHTLADSQHARIFANGDGEMAYVGHVLPSASFTPTATFSDDDTQIPIGPRLKASQGDRQQHTRVEASDGTRTVAIGADATVADNDLKLTVFPGITDDQPADAALRHYRDVSATASQIDELAVHFADLTTAQKQAVLALGLTSPIRALRHPAAGGTRTYDGEIRRIIGRVTDEAWTVELAATTPGPTYVPSARATESSHQEIADNVVTAPSVGGERWDTDGLHLSIVTETGVPIGNNLYHRSNDRYLVVAQTWWEGGITGIRESTVANGVDSTIEARVRDLGINNGTAQQVGVLRQAPNAGPGDPVENSRLTVRHTQGAPLDLFSAPLGDANWAFAPDFTAVRIPSAARACRATKTAAASITSTASPGAGQTLIQWEGTDRFDVGSMHDPASNNSRVTVGKTGTYFALATLGIESSSAGSRMASIRRNGTSTIARGGCLPPTSEDAYFQVAGLWKMTAITDYLEVLAWQDTGSGKNLLKSAPTSPEFMVVELVQSARAHKTTGPSITNNTDTQLTFESEVWDDAACFTAGGSSMTVQWDGPTLIGGQVSWFGNGTGDRWVWLVVNGIVVAQLRSPALTSGAETPQCPWTIWDCHVGDTVQMWVRQSSGAGLALQSVADYASDLYIAQIATGP